MASTAACTGRKIQAGVTTNPFGGDPTVQTEGESFGKSSLIAYSMCSSPGARFALGYLPTDQCHTGPCKHCFDNINDGTFGKCAHRQYRGILLALPLDPYCWSPPPSLNQLSLVSPNHVSAQTIPHCPAPFCPKVWHGVVWHTLEAKPAWHGIT